MAAMADRRPMIITFKREDQRSTAADKQDIAREVVSSRVDFFTAADFSRSEHPVASGIDREVLGYDVNRYHAPILMAALTDDDIAALGDNEDVVAVEEDGEVRALAINDYTVEPQTASMRGPLARAPGRRRPQDAPPAVTGCTRRRSPTYTPGSRQPEDHAPDPEVFAPGPRVLPPELEIHTDASDFQDVVPRAIRFD